MSKQITASDPFQNARKYAASFHSWQPWFKRRVAAARAAMAQESPHLRIAWLETMPVIDRKAKIGEQSLAVQSHAPWLNGEAIAYRHAVGKKTYSGFFIS